MFSLLPKGRGCWQDTSYPNNWLPEQSTKQSWDAEKLEGTAVEHPCPVSHRKLEFTGKDTNEAKPGHRHILPLEKFKDHAEYKIK